MGIFDETGDFSRLMQGAARNDREYKRRAEGGLKQARESTLEVGALLLEIFGTLPAALLSAEKTEYARLVERYDEKHPRAREIETSVRDLEQLEELAARGRARATRAIAALRMPGPVFHGFVTDENGSPLAGLRVTLAGIEGRGYTTTTEADGYFALPLPEMTKGSDLEPKTNSERERAAAEREESVVATVVIADRRGGTLYEDPVPLEIEFGSAYREYRLGGRPEYEEPAKKPAKARKRGGRQEE